MKIDATRSGRNTFLINFLKITTMYKLLVFDHNENNNRYDKVSFELQIDANDYKAAKSLFSMLLYNQIGIIIGQNNLIQNISTEKPLNFVRSKSDNSIEFIAFYNSDVLKFKSNEVNIIDNWIVDFYKFNTLITSTTLKNFTV